MVVSFFCTSYDTHSFIYVGNECTNSPPMLLDSTKALEAVNIIPGAIKQHPHQ